ncbi:hypothetical protein [Rhodoferax sp.]|uniref:hypothetical protein n=1 Tax=Rhodoferax sp. TaxID=50421 RepID=UPI002761B4FA|nr:hypothetical protein [Rhodoferax sp.]
MTALKNTILISALLLACTSAALAKLPAPSDEAKAKAVEAAAKTAWGGKVDGYLLCKSQDKVAAHHAKTAKAAGKEVKPAPALPACADPGAFVYAPAAAAAPAVASAPAAAATPAAAAPGAPAKKP